MTEFQVEGFIGRLGGIGKLLHGLCHEAAQEAAEYVLAQSMQEVPHDTGDLQSSGKVTVDEAAGVAVVSYDTPYALVQHEDMTFKHPGGRKAKYLEDPMNAAAQGDIQAIYKRRVGKAFEG